MASPEKIVALCFTALVVLNFVSLMQGSSNAAFEDKLNDWQERIKQQEDVSFEADDDDNFIVRYASNAANWFGDVWNAISLSVSFIWLFSSAPFTNAITIGTSMSYAEQIVITGLSMLSVGLWLVALLNLYLILVNKKT